MINIRIRPANENDMLLLFKWVNDKETRKASFNQKPIDIQTHTKWFRKNLSSRNVHMLIVEHFSDDAWKPVGQVRIDEKNEIHISITPEMRGKGISSLAIKKSVDYMHEKFKIKTFTAHIKPENTASIKAFESAGFHFSGNKKIKGQVCFEYIENFD